MISNSVVQPRRVKACLDCLTRYLTENSKTP
nr:MAG TPA: hypothetical protein [Caudoviricetes sp.]